MLNAVAGAARRAMDDLELFKRLGIALAIGGMLGIERGWELRGVPDGTRIAGIRSFALMGLLGGLWGVLGLEAGDVAMAVGFLAFAALIVAAHVMHLRNLPADQGITTELAELVTFALGAVAARGHLEAAAAGGVISLALLSLKAPLHRFVAAISLGELRAAVQLLLISVVLLPILPNKGYGPAGALNPYHAWLLVVMIAAIGFVGYVAIKIAGPRLGILFTGVFGGLASSTALTLSFSRLGRETPELRKLLAVGVVVAGATMFPRILLIVSVVNPAVTAVLLVPMAVMTAVGFAAAAILWLGAREVGMGAPAAVSNPFDLWTALKFAAFLAVVLLASGLLQKWYGNAGVYGLAALDGLADVDAISLSVSRLASQQALAAQAAAVAVGIAAIVNMLVKAGMVVVLGGGTMGRRVVVATAAMILAGGVAVALR